MLGGATTAVPEDAPPVPVRLWHGGSLATVVSQLVVGPMDSLVRDAGMKKLMSW